MNYLVQYQQNPKNKNRKSDYKLTHFSITTQRKRKMLSPNDVATTIMDSLRNQTHQTNTPSSVNQVNIT
jgi:hypothetical protein